MYFNLRGEHVIRASMKAAVWDRLPQKPARGDQVHAFGKMEFWRGRAEVTMAVERLEPSGEGLLLAAHPGAAAAAWPPTACWPRSASAPCR